MAATSQQCMDALASANAKRVGIAQFRRDVRTAGPAAGAAMVARAIDEEYDAFVLGSARIGHLLRAVPRLGEHKVTRCLLAAGVRTFDRKLRDLTARQRGALVIQLEMWARDWSS
jgi:hypothetical protein